MKSQDGITLMVLVIMIIVILIISGIGIGASTGLNGNIQQSKNNIVTAELSEVQQIVLETYIKYKQTNNSNYLVGTQITYEQASSYLSELDSSLSLQGEDYDGETTVSQDSYYYELSPSNLETLGINDSEDTYIVNYYTGEVFNYTYKKTSDGNALYIYK